jgi:hypothetical protein
MSSPKKTGVHDNTAIRGCASDSGERKRKEKDVRPQNGVYRLDLSIMLRNPELNYKLYDDAEIYELESYLIQYHNIHEEYKEDKNFKQNWCNCDTACKYFWNDIFPIWKISDDLDGKGLGLKQAIREGRAFNAHGSLMDLPDAEKILNKMAEDLDRSQKNE